MIYGYARVSTKEQNLDRQLEEFKNYNIDKIYCEKKSGKNFKDRDQYQKMLKKLKKGDLLIIMSIDRLGRNYEEILNQWRIIVEDKKCDIQVLDFPMLNTRNGGGGLEGKFLSNVVLQILSYVAEKERQKIKERQAQGIKIAKEKGVKFGKPKAVLPSNADEILNQYIFREITCIKASELLGISRGTLFRVLKDKSLKQKRDYKNHKKSYKHPKIKIDEIRIINQVHYLKSKLSYKIVAYKKNGEKIEGKSSLLLGKKLYVSKNTILNFMKGKNTCLNDDIEKIEKVYYRA